MPRRKQPIVDAARFRSVAIDIGRFRKRYSVSLDVLSALLDNDRRRVTEWIEGKTPESPEIAETFYALHKRMQHDRTRLLDELGVSQDKRDPSDRSAPSERLVPHEIPAPTAGSQTHIAYAMQLARIGHHYAAFGHLSQTFLDLFQHAESDAMQCLPSLIYIGYRYMPRVPFINTLTHTVIQPIESLGRRIEVDDLVRGLCQTQIACALSDGGNKPLATMMFQRWDLKPLFDGKCGELWFGPQLLRAAAMFSQIYESNPQRAIDRAQRAAEMNSNPGNQLSVATTAGIAYLSIGNHRKAVKVIDRVYITSRETLLEYMNSPNALTYDVFHLAGAVYQGAFSHYLRYPGYRTTNLKEDLAIMNWATRRFQWPGIGGGAIELAKSLDKFPEMRPFHKHCTPPLLVDYQSAALLRLVKLLDWKN